LASATSFIFSDISHVLRSNDDSLLGNLPLDDAVDFLTLLETLPAFLTQGSYIMKHIFIADILNADT